VPPTRSLLCLCRLFAKTWWGHLRSAAILGSRGQADGFQVGFDCETGGRYIIEHSQTWEWLPGLPLRFRGDHRAEPAGCGERAFYGGPPGSFFLKSAVVYVSSLRKSGKEDTIHEDPFVPSAGLTVRRRFRTLPKAGADHRAGRRLLHVPRRPGNTDCYGFIKKTSESED